MDNELEIYLEKIIFFELLYIIWEIVRYVWDFDELGFFFL